MKQFLLKVLKALRIYYPLQSLYHGLKFLLVNYYYKLTFLPYKGKGFTCNFCGARYSKFVPEYPSKNIIRAIKDNEVIAGYGANVYCPNCMSKNRERLVLAVLQQVLPVDGKEILHFSPEKHLYDFLQERARVVTVDIEPAYYQSIDRNIGYADATKLQFGNNSFDLVIANHILEHIPEDRQAMKEIHRVLKDNGLAILQVPYSEKLATTIEEPFINDPSRQELLFGQKDHVRIYSRNDYIQRLQSAGFRVVMLSADKLLEYEKYAVQQDECVFLCYKK